MSKNRLKVQVVDNLQFSNVSQLTHLVYSCFVGLVFLGSFSFFTNLVTLGRWRGTSSFLILMPSIRIPGPTIIFEGLVQIWRPCLRHDRRSQFYQFIGRIHYQIKLRQLHLFFLGIIIDINVNFVRNIFVDCKIAEIQRQNVTRNRKCLIWQDQNFLPINSRNGVKAWKSLYCNGNDRNWSDYCFPSNHWIL